MGAGGDDVGECGWEDGGYVEGAMKRDRHGAGQLDKLSGTDKVDAAGRSQEAEDNAVGAELFGEQDVALHDLEFVRGVAEISSPWAHQHVKRESDPLADHGNQPRARGDASIVERAAELDAVCPAALGGHRGGDGIDSDFEQDGHEGRDARGF